MAYKNLLIALMMLAVVPRLQAQNNTGNDKPLNAQKADTVWVGHAPDTANEASLPFTIYAPGMDGFMPYYGGGFGNSWALHKGFNAQAGLSLSAAFGKHAPRGVGFGQNAAFAYAAPLSKRLSVAAGIYAANMDWGAWHQTDIGIAALAAFKVTDWADVYAYYSKSIVARQGQHQPFARPLSPFYPEGGDRYGIMGDFKLGGNVSIQVGMEYSSSPNNYYHALPSGISPMRPYGW